MNLGHTISDWNEVTVSEAAVYRSPINLFMTSLETLAAKEDAVKRLFTKSGKDVGNIRSID